MRISEDRYTRDLRRLHLARRLIQYEVRTRWICACTGLSGNRVRNLFHSYQESLGSARRRRGPSRRQVSSFLTSPTLDLVDRVAPLLVKHSERVASHPGVAEYYWQTLAGALTPWNG